MLPCVAMAFGTGCAARVYSGPVGTYPGPVEEDAIVYVDTVPPNIEAYPRYSYNGGDSYYVDGRWYRRGPRGWGYYREEPPELARQRPYVVQVGRPPSGPREHSEGERPPANSRDRPYVQQPAPDRPYVQEPAPERRYAQPAPERPSPQPAPERPYVQPPAAPRPVPGVVEAQRPGEAPRRARPPEKRTEAPGPKERER